MRNKKVGYYIGTPKPKSGVRQVPMSEEACQIFQKVLKHRKKAETIMAVQNCIIKLTGIAMTLLSVYLLAASWKL